MHSANTGKEESIREKAKKEGTGHNIFALRLRSTQREGYFTTGTGVFSSVSRITSSVT
jgi:hypothetical protein